MLNKSVILGATLLTAMVAMNAQASKPMTFSKPISATVPLNTNANGLTSAKKEVFFMNVNLTPAQKHQIQHYLVSENSYAGKNDDKLPKHAELSMNNTPVLNQGRHGSCVTFAVTAAIDALLGRGDYVSQLCSLALGSEIERNGYFLSGWNGTFSDAVIDQIQKFGIVNKDAQRANSCGGLTEYPVNDESNEGTPMSLSDHKAISENVGEYGLWSQPIMSMFKRFSDNFDGSKYVDKVKKSLATPQSDGLNYRVVFSVLVPVKHCFAGACGTYHNQFDSWVLSKEIRKDEDLALGGHEMVITGYDDKAVATDTDGKTHKGLFTLRNSWGSDVGDQGNYYMSYDFFMRFATSVDQVYVPSGF